MVKAGISAARIERFDHCGSDCCIEATQDGKKFRVRANHCGDRFCEPCSNARGAKIREKLKTMMGTEECSFLTFTLQASTDGLIEVLNHLLASFTRLREQKTWKKKMLGGAAFVEITLGAKKDHWHVHLHCLCLAGFISGRVLSDMWRSASRGSWIVHTRPVKNAEQDANYVGKYATKGWNPDVLNDEQRLIECMVALRGRRLLMTFGKWRKIEEEGPLKERYTWVKVASLTSAVEAAARKEAWAVGLLAAIGCPDLMEFPDLLPQTRTPGQLRSG
jgi:hypothetical protein